ncbi:universal stress protein [Kitasatospora sp. NPDC085464]|uniref:universal stress protein n=1 Tax=Kitasatospora sp. NPDC085464 TaxID=3364063 RepID=UPI0037C6ABC7
MSHSVVVGIDGSEQSTAAAAWAAAEADRSGRALRMIHVGGAEDGRPLRPAGADDGLPPELLAVRDRLTADLPGLDLSCERIPGSPAHALAAAGARGGLIVLGSRGLGGFTGLLVGSVGLRVAADALCPVVLVRAGTGTGAGADREADGEADAAADAAGDVAGDVVGDVVVGVQGDRACAEVLAFAFEQAARRGVTLRVLESRSLPAGPYVTQAPVDQREIRDSLAEAELVRLRDALARWRDKFPRVRVEAEVTARHAGGALVDASRGASLVVLGRRTPAHQAGVSRLGSVAHAVLHHALCPVAIVPRD